MADRKRIHGIAAFLKEGSKVYYENLFSLRAVGRISDLMVARLGDAWPHTCQLRALLLFAATEGMRLQRRGPVTLECGTDGERLAVSVAFRWVAGEAAQEYEAFRKRVEATAGVQCDQLLLRREAASGRADLLMVAEWLEPRGARLELVEGELLDLPASLYEFVQMGDLDYRELLAARLERDGGRAADLAGDRVLVKGRKPGGQAADEDAQPDQVLAELESGELDQLLHRYYKEKDELKGTLPEGAPVWRWVHRAMADLVSEKDRLSQLARIARKAMLRSAEEGARKDEALAKAQAILGDAQRTIERLKKEKAAELGEAEGRRGPAPAELGLLRAQLERTQKQVEEFKRANQQLLDKIHELQQREPAEGSADQLRRRLQAAMKNLAEARRQAERLSADLESAREREAQLKAELAKRRAG